MRTLPDVNYLGAKVLGDRLRELKITEKGVPYVGEGAWSFLSMREGFRRLAKPPSQELQRAFLFRSMSAIRPYVEVLARHQEMACSPICRDMVADDSIFFSVVEHVACDVDKIVGSLLGVHRKGYRPS